MVACCPALSVEMESAASVLASVEEDVKLFQERLGLAFATSEGEIQNCWLHVKGSLHLNRPINQL